MAWGLGASAATPLVTCKIPIIKYGNITVMMYIFFNPNRKWALSQSICRKCNEANEPVDERSEYPL